ncbi:MarR family transcriptional regulator [Halioxenophilus aromaticivorans]
MPTQHYDPESFQSKDSLGYLIKVAYTMMLGGAEQAFDGSGLSFIQWITLRKLREHQSLTPGNLCQVLRHDSGAMTRMLDQLVKAGYVNRQRSEEDRRVVELSLTQAGEAKVDELLPQFLDELNKLCGIFDEQEFVQFKAMLKRLISHVGEVTGREVPESLR